MNNKVKSLRSFVLIATLCGLCIFANHIHAQEAEETLNLSYEEFLTLEVTRDLQAAILARHIQKLNLVNLNLRLSSQVEKRGELLLEIERNEFLSGELERYLDIRKAAFRKTYDERGSNLNWEVLWEQIITPITERIQSFN